MNIDDSWTGSSEELLSQIATLLDGRAVSSKQPLPTPGTRWLIRIAEQGIIDPMQGDHYSYRHLLQCLLAVKLIAAGWTAEQMAAWVPTVDKDTLLDWLGTPGTPQAELSSEPGLENSNDQNANAKPQEATPEQATLSPPELAARLLAAGVLQQYQQARDQGTPVVHDHSMPASLRQAMALLSRLRIDEGKIDHCASLHQVLTRCTEPLGSPAWAIDAFSAEVFDFSDVRLIDPYHRCPTPECVELGAGVGVNHSNVRQHIEEAMSFTELSTLCAKFGARRDAAYTQLRQFIGRNPLTTHAAIDAFVQEHHISAAEQFLRGCWSAPDARHLINDRLHGCRHCQAPLEAYGDNNGRCIQRLCGNYRVPVPLSEGRDDTPRMRVLAAHLMTYWYGPAIDELRVYDRAIELGLPVFLYPYSDACDVAIGDDIGIDVKGYSSPQLLGQALNRSIGGLTRYARRIVAISDVAATANPGYLKLLKRTLGSNPHRLELMRVSELLRKLETLT